MLYHLRIVQVQFYQVIVAFPTLIPQVVPIGIVAAKVYKKPVFITGLLSLFQHVLKCPKAATDVIKHTVKHHTNTCFVKCCAHVGKVPVRSQAHIDFLIIARVVAMPIRLKYGREVHGIAAKPRQMGYPVNDLENSMFKHTVILAWCTAKPNGINLVENALVCPTD